MHHRVHHYVIHLSNYVSTFELHQMVCSTDTSGKLSMEIAQKTADRQKINERKIKMWQVIGTPICPSWSIMAYQINKLYEVEDELHQWMQFVNQTHFIPVALRRSNKNTDTSEPLWFGLSNPKKSLKQPRCKVVVSVDDTCLMDIVHRMYRKMKEQSV